MAELSIEADEGGVVPRAATWVQVSGAIVALGFAICACSSEAGGDAPVTQTSMANAVDCVAIPPDSVFGTSNGRFCITWQAAEHPEHGFRITLDYGDGGEVFRYEVPADKTAFVVPIDDAPPANGDQALCLARANRQVLVESINSDGLTIVAAGAMNTECPGFPGS